MAEAPSEGRRCRSCAAPLRRPVADLGLSPLANSYVEPEDLDRPEPFYPLIAYLCESCLLVQLADLRGGAGPEEIFGDYAYFSSYSTTWVEHARRYAEMAVERFGLGPESLVVELASNDGYLLRHFVDRGVPVLGVEPARNVAEAAVAAGIPTRNVFFGEASAHEIVRDRGRADLVIGNNVLAHVPALNDFVAGISALLAEDGRATLEFPHLLRLLEEHQFDTIYHEHFSYFSLHAAAKVFERHGLELFDVAELETHGGSLRVYLRQASDLHDSPGNKPRAHGASRAEGAKQIDPRREPEAFGGGLERVAALLEKERGAGLLDPATYDAFEERVRATKRSLLRFLLDARERGEVVAGYGAPAKGNTLLNYCGVGPDLLPLTVDRSPHKQGRFLPGTRIPIAAPERLRELRPDYVLILPWNLKEEIVEQMAEVRSWGGRFVVAIPELEVL